MRHSYYYISFFASCFDIPVSLGSLFQRIASINDRFYLPRLSKFFEEGKIFGLDAANGDVLWQFQAGEGEIVESPVVAGDTIYVASVDGTLYAITGGD